MGRASSRAARWITCWSAATAWQQRGSLHARHGNQTGSPPEITFYKGDRREAVTLQHAFTNFGADLVIDIIGFEPGEAQVLYELTRGRIRHMLFISTVDTYGYPLSRIPFREQDETGRRACPDGNRPHTPWAHHGVCGMLPDLAGRRS